MQDAAVEEHRCENREGRGAEREAIELRPEQAIGHEREGLHERVEIRSLQNLEEKNGDVRDDQEPFAMTRSRVTNGTVRVEIVSRSGITRA